MDSTGMNETAPRRGSGLPWVLLVLVIAVAAAAGYFGYGLFNEERQKALAALKAGEESAAKVGELTARVTELETAKGTLEADLKAKEEELAKLRATYDSLNSQLQEEIAKGEISLTQQGERIQVDLVDKILFASGQAEITERGQEILKRLGGAIANVENKLIQVSGHTDDAPPVREIAEKYPTNWELSAARATNVTRFLAEKGGVPAKRLVAAAHGQFHPIATNANPTGRARNRRIEILLTPKVDLKPVDEGVVAVQPAKASAPATVKPASAKKSSGR